MKQVFETIIDSPIYTDNGKRGMYLPPKSCRPLPPVIAFDTKTPTEIDPESFPICPIHGVWIVDCDCGSEAES
jgi:hypothetical protein